MWALDPRIVFLNHGSFGATPRPVLEVQDRLRAQMESEPVRFFTRDLEPLLDAARAALAAFIGATAEDVAFVPNATAGANAVLRSLPLVPGDEILVTDHAYGACRNAVDFVAARTGAHVVVARVPFPLGSPDEVVDVVLGHVTSRIRLALLDHVTSGTALVMPIERLVAALAERGVDTLVDGAHAPGMVALEARDVLLRGLGGAPPAPDAMIGAMVTLPLPGAAHVSASLPPPFDPLQDALLDRFGIEVPVFPGDRPGRRLIRVSCQLYNTIEQYERLAAALVELLEIGRAGAP